MILHDHLRVHFLFADIGIRLTADGAGVTRKAVRAYRQADCTVTECPVVLACLAAEIAHAIGPTEVLTFLGAVFAERDSHLVTEFVKGIVFAEYNVARVCYGYPISVLGATRVV